MCDCYGHKCEGCGVRIEVHIADFCIPREDLYAFCPKCAKTLDIEDILSSEAIFLDRITDEDQVEGLTDGKVLFLSGNPKAYGIHLN